MKNIKELLIFDFETTGLSPVSEEILEIGAIKYEKVDGKFVEVDSYEQILLTTNPISDFIKNLTNITDEMQLELGVSQEEGAKKLYSMINEDTLLIAYNIQFDLGFLEALFKRHLDPSYNISNDLLDVMAIYKDNHKFPHRLENAVEMYQIDLVNTHRALDDVRATHAVLKAFKYDNEQLTKYINVIGSHPKYGVNGPVNDDRYEYVVQYGGNKEIYNHTKKKR